MEQRAHCQDNPTPQDGELRPGSMLLSQISNECWLLPVVEGQVGQGREVPDKDLKESAGAGAGGTADSELGQAEVWVLMVPEHKDQPTTGSERHRRCLILYQGSAGA